MVRYFKVGGLRFLRVGRLQLSWCVVKPKPKPDALKETSLRGWRVIEA